MSNESPTKPFYNANTNTGYLPAARAKVSIVKADIAPSASAAASVKQDDGKPALITSPKLVSHKKWVQWGDDDNFPNHVIDKIGLSGVASAALYHNILTCHGDGFEFGKYVIENRKRIWEPIDINDNKYAMIYDFVEESDIQDDYLFEAISDLFWFANFFPYIILNKGRNKINKLYTAEAAYSRLSPIDEKGRKPLHFYSAQFPNPQDEAIETPLLSDYDTYGDLVSRSSGYRFAMHCYLASPGKSYYQKPYWDSIRANGWLDVAIEVPKWMKAIFKNSMHLKYHIQIPITHFTAKYREWSSKTEKEQNDLIEKELEAMDKFLAGSDNARKAFFSFVDQDDSGKQNEGWKIEAIQDYDKDGKYLPESSAANSEILFAFLTHPDLIGAGTPGGYNSGRSNSGSNTRETDLLKKASMALFRNRVIKPLYLVKRFNNWPKEVEIRIPDTVLTTLDNGAQAMKSLNNDGK